MIASEDDRERIADLTDRAHDLLASAIEREIVGAGKELAGVAVLFSGGNDSTTLAHLFRNVATHAAHANTGIGIEDTRQYVRDTCATWGLPLLERHVPAGYTYRDLVLGRCVARTRGKEGTVMWPGGFPGPASHYMMYQKLKELALARIRNEIVQQPSRRRVIFLAGRRSEESDRRKHLADVDPIERRGSAVWVSPLVGWTKLDLNAYRRVHTDVPSNQVSDMLHMSGECLCGSFAHAGELDEIADWYPATAQEIRDLEKEVLAEYEAGRIVMKTRKDGRVLTPEEAHERCHWGWGAGKEKPSKSGPMCSSCAGRFTPPTE